MGLVGVAAPSREVAAVTLLVVALASGTTRPTAAYVLAPPSSSPCTRGTLLLSLDCPVNDSASALFTPRPVTLLLLTPTRHPGSLYFIFCYCFATFIVSIYFVFNSFSLSLSPLPFFILFYLFLFFEVVLTKKGG